MTIETIERELAAYTEAAEKGQHHIAATHVHMLAYFAREVIKERDSLAGDTGLMDAVRGEVK